MRDPDRIDEVLAELGIYWKRNPDLRLCQIVGNFLSEQYPAQGFRDELIRPMSSRGYNTEDDGFIRYLRSRNG